MKKKKKEKKIGKFFKEYRDFASKGNIVNLAVAVVIGTAFTKIVNSLVADIIMPLISLMTGKEGFTEWKWILVPATEGSTEVAISYGIFLQAIIDFLIISFCIFVVLKIITNSQKKLEELSHNIIEKVKNEREKEQSDDKSTIIQVVEQPAQVETKVVENNSLIEEEKLAKLEENTIKQNEEIKLLQEIRDLLSEKSKKNNK